MRVLMMEDEPLIALTLRELLEGFGFETVEATSPEHAFRIMEFTTIELVITALHFGDLRADHFVEDLRMADRKLPIVITTGYRPDDLELPDDVRTALLSKPYSDDDLKRAISSVLNSKSPFA